MNKNDCKFSDSIMDVGSYYAERRLFQLRDLVSCNLCRNIKRNQLKLFQKYQRNYICPESISPSALPWRITLNSFNSLIGSLSVVTGNCCVILIEFNWINLKKNSINCEKNQIHRIKNSVKSITIKTKLSQLNFKWIKIK